MENRVRGKFIDFKTSSENFNLLSEFVINALQFNDCHKFLVGLKKKLRDKKDIEDQYAPATISLNKFYS